MQDTVIRRETIRRESERGVRQFTEVDNTTDPRWFIDFMDAANELPGHHTVNHRLASNLGYKEQMRVLDVGTGTGDDARQLLDLLPLAAEITGVDVSQAMVDEARLRHASAAPRLRFALTDGSRLDFENGYFDAVRGKLVLMHCDDIGRTFDEMLRVVKPGGRIALFDYDFDCLAVDHPDQELTRQIVRRFSNGTRNNWSARQLFRRFTVKGLADVTVEPIVVPLPFSVFEPMVSGRKSSQADAGNRPVASAEDAWWNELSALAAAGLFFSAFTGFLVSGTKQAGTP